MRVDMHLVVRQLADQLIVVFVVGLLCLWLAATRLEVHVPAERGEWWHFVILSVFAVLLWLFVGRRKMRSPRYRWALLCVMVAFVWFSYLIAGISVPPAFFTVLGIVLLIAAALLLLGLIVTMVAWRAEREPHKIIIKIARCGSLFCWPLTLIAISASVLQGLAALSGLGVTGWWLTPLAYTAVSVLIVAGLAYTLTSTSGGDL